jgi:hypothetical protein
MMTNLENISKDLPIINLEDSNVRSVECIYNSFAGRVYCDILAQDITDERCQDCEYHNAKN